MKLPRSPKLCLYWGLHSCVPPWFHNITYYTYCAYRIPALIQFGDPISIPECRERVSRGGEQRTSLSASALVLGGIFRELISNRAPMF